jgi:hypothetical protein
VVSGRPLSLVTVTKFNISARGKFSTGRTQQLFPGCVNIGSLGVSLKDLIDMATLRFIGYLLFRHYNKTKYNSVPYFSTICAMTLLAFFHVMQILILTNTTAQIITYKPTDDLLTKRLAILWIMLPIGLIIYFLLPKKLLRTLKFDEAKIKRGYIYLITYGILSFSLIFIFARLK